MKAKNQAVRQRPTTLLLPGVNLHEYIHQPSSPLLLPVEKIDFVQLLDDILNLRKGKEQYYVASISLFPLHLGYMA